MVLHKTVRSDLRWPSLIRKRMKPNVRCAKLGVRIDFACIETLGIKRIGIILLQLLVTGAGIWYVFHDPHKRTQVVDALRHADKLWIGIGWICYGAVELLATVRWQLLLRIQKITRPLSRFAI